MNDSSSFSPLMVQNWGKLLFMHWPLKPEALRPFIPAQLEVETFDGSAWIAIVPFTMWGIRHACLPPLPGLSKFHELNVRTYVKYRGVSAVWFFSLDATNLPAIWSARRFYHLPYYRARMELQQQGDEIHYESHRAQSSAMFDARWRVGEPLPRSTPGSLVYFLTERYRLLSMHRDEVYTATIQHEPWPLRKAELVSLQSTMITAATKEEPAGPPLLHYAESLKVKIGALSKI